MTLLPVKIKLDDGQEKLVWKLWILSTMLENLDRYPENEALLKSPGRRLEGLETIETDVFIIGGGNAAASLAARLKALGVDSVCADRNPRVGDNWALRYDCMKFHLPTSFTHMAYMSKHELGFLRSHHHSWRYLCCVRDTNTWSRNQAIPRSSSLHTCSPRTIWLNKCANTSQLST